MVSRIRNVQSDRDAVSEIIEVRPGELRSVLRVFNVSGLTWKEKRDRVHNELIRVYGDVPDGVSYMKRGVNAKDKSHNPDGMRLMVHTDWMNRQRFCDDKGKFHIGTLLKAINKEVEGLTRPRLRVSDEEIERMVNNG